MLKKNKQQQQTSYHPKKTYIHNTTKLCKQIFGCYHMLDNIRDCKQH